jgi:hypothetical protein
MEYTVKRGEQTYGPYSLGDLQKYVQSGNIALTDLTQSEGMNDWAPISQVIGTVQVPAEPVYGAPAAIDPWAESVSLPPNLHWILVLLMNIVFRFAKLGISFNAIWMLVLANWARKLEGDNNILVYAAMYPASLITGIIAVRVLRTGGISREAASAAGVLLILVGFIAYLIGIFKIKAAMESYYNSNENIGLLLSGVMTFFFGCIYLQFHVNRIAKWKSTGILD